MGIETRQHNLYKGNKVSLYLESKDNSSTFLSGSYSLYRMRYPAVLIGGLQHLGVLQNRSLNGFQNMDFFNI
jgi:hypothetical protein